VAEKFSALLLFSCLLAGSLSVQTAAQTQYPREVYLPPATSQAKMTIADVIKLSKAGVGDDLIIQQLKKKNHVFDLSTDQILQLKAAHVSDRVVQVMLDPRTDSVQPPAVKTASPPVPVQTQQPALQASRQESPDPALPSEIGVYAKVKGKWTEVLPEVVNWKTGGVVKSVATVGIVKGDLNGHINGASSRNHLTTPLEFLIVVPDGVAITEYQLLKLHQHGSSREFRTVTGGVFHVSGGATRDLLSFEGVKVASRTYSAKLSTATGEYGLLPPGAVFSTNAAASTGKIYSFRVVE
jgi:hypothetical protein